MKRRTKLAVCPVQTSSSGLPGIRSETKPGIGRDYRAERLHANAAFIDDLMNIRQQAEEGLLDRDKWMCLVKFLLDCPLPYRPTALRQVTRRTRFHNRWVTITYTACRPDVEMPRGADNKLLHWLFDLGIRQSQEATNSGKDDSQIIRYKSTRRFLTDCGMADSDGNYKTIKASFRRLTGLAITVQFENDREEAGEIIRLLAKWRLPKSIAKTAGTRKGSATDEYGFVLSKELLDHIKKYSIRMPRQLWRLLKGKPLKCALLLWMFHRAWSAEGESKIKWAILRRQFWYAQSNSHRLEDYVEEAVSSLLVMWPTANIRVEDDGVVFDKATGYLLPDDITKKRVRRLRNA